MADRTISTRLPITRTTAPMTIDSGSIATPSRTGASIPTTTSIPSSRTSTSVGRTIQDYITPIPPSQTDLAEINKRILTNTGNYIGLGNAIGGPYGTTSAGATNGNSTVDTNNPLTNSPIYGTGNPFDILGDAFAKAFGGSTYNPQPQQPSTIVQPVGTSGGGSSIALILILAAIGGGIYYWYKHRG